MSRTLLIKYVSALALVLQSGRGEVEITSSNENSYEITCKGNSTLDDMDISLFNKTISVLAINKCPPPEMNGPNNTRTPRTYLDTLTALGLDTSSILSMRIADVPHSSPLKNEHLQGSEKFVFLGISEEDMIYNLFLHDYNIVYANGLYDFSYGGILGFFCFGNRLEDQRSPWFNQTLRPRLLSISQCPLPRSTYAEDIKRLGIDPAFFKLRIMKIPNNETLNESHIKGLSVKAIEIHNGDENRGQGTTQYLTIAKGGVLDLTDGIIANLRCYNLGGVVPINKLRPVIYNSTVRVSTLEIDTCKIPETSYAEALQAVGIDPASILVLKFIRLYDKVPFRPEHFENLPIRSLELSTFLGKPYDKEVLQSADKAFEKLVNLTFLSVKNLVMSPLPATSHLHDVTLSSGASSGSFGGCGELRNLTLVQWDVVQPMENNGWLANCSNLNKLELKQMEKHLVRSLLIGANSLTLLTIEECSLESISEDFFEDTNQLKELQLVNNDIMEIEKDAFKSTQETEVLNLSGNRIRYWQNVRDAIRHLVELRTLFLAYNILEDLCDSDLRGSYGYNEDDGGPPSPRLKSFSLHATNVSKLCFQEWETLESLNLSDSRITELKFDKLPSPLNHTLVIDLRGNPLQEYPRTSSDYDMITSKFSQVKNVTVKLNMSLECDCQHAWFARALKDTPRLTVEGARCNTGEELRNVPVQQLECNKTVCAAGCVCRVPWSDTGTDVECSGTELTEVPRVRNLRSLTAPGNFIENIRGIDLPDSLLILDIRNNHLSRMDAETAATLFSVPTRRIKLGANPIACDCENQPFLFELQSHRSQVEDYDNVTCVGSDLPVRDVVVDALCQAEQERAVLVAASVGGAFLVLTLILLVLYRRYRQTIKVFLYSRGCCLRWLHEEEIDSDRPYDAFLSFSHKDESFIAEHLLPGLEEIPEPYRVCVHLRDWIAGELIPTQIAKSIQQSRRTIIVLSKAFIESIWGMLEFRMAFTNSLREGRQRVILVVLDDVVHDEGLAPDLKDYVASTTYVRWGDPWFWQKLRYALPHRRRDASPPPAYSVGDVTAVGSQLELQNCPVTIS